MQTPYSQLHGSKLNELYKVAQMRVCMHVFCMLIKIGKRESFLHFKSCSSWSLAYTSHV